MTAVQTIGQLFDAESVRTLALQGGAMTAAEVTAFEALPFLP